MVATAKRLAVAIGLSLTITLGSSASGPGVAVERLPGNPIIIADDSGAIGNDVNGPSVIRVPDWVPSPLGRYYLYFAHHKGKHIRLAWANEPGGPWTLYEPGTLSLAESWFPTGIISTDGLPPDMAKRVDERRASGDDPLYTHVASPEVIVVPEDHEIRMYYHGMQENGSQATRVAISHDGIHFTARPQVLTRPYLRIFKWQGYYYGLAMPGVFYRSKTGTDNFEEGPTLFNANMRHTGLVVRGNLLYVFWTQVGDAPERILLSTIDISGDWRRWQASSPTLVMQPETVWEGAELPVLASTRGAIEEPANQLRDPFVFEEAGNTWLFYSVAGEAGIGVARLQLK